MRGSHVPFRLGRSWAADPCTLLTPQLPLCPCCERAKSCTLRGFSLLVQDTQYSQHGDRLPFWGSCPSGTMLEPPGQEPGLPPPKPLPNPSQSPRGLLALGTRTENQGWAPHTCCLSQSFASVVQAAITPSSTSTCQSVLRPTATWPFWATPVL